MDINYIFYSNALFGHCGYINLTYNERSYFLNEKIIKRQNAQNYGINFDNILVDFDRNDVADYNLHKIKKIFGIACLNYLLKY